MMPKHAVIPRVAEPPGGTQPVLWLARPRGFCAGVERAIAIVERALALFGAPVYVFHEIVHNEHVVRDLRARGAVFVDDLEQVPPQSVTVFSAHGVALSVACQAYSRALDVIDATCPLVGKVHQQVQRYAAQGRALVMIGHAGHDEVVGTMGRVSVPVHRVATAAEVEHLPLAPDAPVAYVTQTTLSIDDTRTVIAALAARFVDLVGPDTDDICYATQNRQNAVRAMAPTIDRLIVVGSANSSNAQRLCEVAQQQGVTAHLVADAQALQPHWLDGARRIGVSAGASTPEAAVQAVVERLRALGADAVHEQPGPDETVHFRLPAVLMEKVA